MRARFTRAERSGTQGLTGLARGVESVKTMKLPRAYVARTIGVSILLVLTAFATTAADDSIALIQLDRVPLGDAIRNLARQAGLNYILDPRVPGSTFGPGRINRAPAVTASWTNFTAGAALEALLREHKLMLVKNPNTTVTRIIPADSRVNAAPASQVGGNAGKIIPLINMDDVPLVDAITHLAKAAELKVAFDSGISEPGFNNQGTVSFRWERITARQALAALIDNYGLVMTEDASTSTARVTLGANPDGEKKQP